MDEDQYKSIVKGRLQRDDFIVDDGIEGYADNGMDDWGQDEQEAMSDEDIKPKREWRTAWGRDVQYIDLVLNRQEEAKNCEIEACPSTTAGRDVQRLQAETQGS